MVVLAGNLLYLGTLGVLAWIYDVDISRMTHASLGSKKLVAVVGKRDASVVSPLVGNLLYFALEVSLIEVQGSVPYADEAEALVVLVPYEALYVRVELL